MGLASAALHAGAARATTDVRRQVVGWIEGCAGRLLIDVDRGAEGLYTAFSDSAMKGSAPGGTGGFP